MVVIRRIHADKIYKKDTKSVTKAELFSKHRRKQPQDGSYEEPVGLKRATLKNLFASDLKEILIIKLFRF